VWKPALFHAGVIREPTRDARGRKQYVSSRANGMHALRHYYASITLADGVNIKELAEYLGHGDPGFTLRLYTHMLPSSHERARKAVDSRLARLFSLKSHGAGTEQAAVRSPQPRGSRTTACTYKTLKSAFDLRECQRIRIPEIAREMTSRWISEVPSKMV
jgi:hypothetical protein